MISIESARNLVLALIIGVLSQADAQPQDSTATATNVILVTATRYATLLKDTPEIVKVISKNEIAEIHPSTTGEILEYATGTALSSGTGSGLADRSVVSLNGLPPNYTLVLVDGVPLLTDHIHTGQNLEFIPPQSIERIEVIRGASSAHYGSDAIGGIVNIITRKASKFPEGSIEASVANYGTYNAGVSLMAPLGHSSGFSTFFSHEQSDGVPLKAPASRIDNMGYERNNFMGSLHTAPTDSTRILSSINWVDYCMDWKGGTTDSYLVTPTLGVDQKLSGDLDWHSGLTYSLWHADLNTEENILLKPETYMTWRTSPGNTVMGGADFKREEFERSRVVRSDRDSLGLFVQDEWICKDQYSVMAALRADAVEDVAAALSPKLSGMVAATESTRLRASIGRGFHAPTLMELYEEGYGHGGRAYRFGNPDLEPETSTTYTVGLEANPVEPVQLLVNGFYSDIDDMIVPVYEGAWSEDPTIDVWRRMNINHAVVYGGEIQLAFILPYHTRIETGYTYTENEDKDTGRQLPYSPGSSLYAKLLVTQHLNGNFRLTEFVGIRKAYGREAWNWKPAPGESVDSENGLTTPLEDFTKLDAGLTLNAGKDYEVYFKVENILGEDIENLDDAYTVIDGEPVYQIGMKYNFPLAK